MTTDPRIDLVARTLDEVALTTTEEGAPPPMAVLREAAAELVEKLDDHAHALFAHMMADDVSAAAVRAVMPGIDTVIERGLSTSSGDDAAPRPPLVETDRDAVRIAADVITKLLARDIPLTAHDAAEHVVRALLDAPIATLDHTTRQVTLQWPSDDVRVALVAREVLDAMVDDANELRAGADFTTIPEGAEPTPAQSYGYLLSASPARRHELLAELTYQRSRGVACWLHGHAEQIENLRRDLDVARAELAEVRARGGHLLAVTEPAGVVTVPAGTTDEQLDQVRAVVPAGVAVERPAPWPDPEVAVDLIDHTDEESAPGTPWPAGR